MGLAVLFAGGPGMAGEPVYGASAGGQGTGIGGEQAPGRGWDASGAQGAETGADQALQDMGLRMKWRGFSSFWMMSWDSRTGEWKDFPSGG